MLVLTIRTDNPEAEIGLFDSQSKLGYEVWHAHRELSMTIHNKINDVLVAHNKSFEDIQGIVCFAGPGSFTGLRIGLSVGNTLAYGLDLPILATQGEEWIADGIKQLESGHTDKVAQPFYGADVHITVPRK
jgi:tRNA threonylcarbamoyladenosine biosynthesis protein TsaB